MCTYLSDKHVLGRKDYKCFGCLSVIEKGTNNRVSVFVDGGQIVTLRLCAVCEKIADDMEPGDEFCEGDLREYHSALAEQPPDAQEA